MRNSIYIENDRLYCKTCNNVIGKTLTKEVILADNYCSKCGRKVEVGDEYRGIINE